MQKSSIKQSGERRLNMDNIFSTGISIEKMAAFLDGNLTASEMQGISSLIDSDASLQRFMDASSVIDESISAFSMSEINLPQELQSPDFELPSLDGDFHGLITLSPEPLPFPDNMMVAACADNQIEDTPVLQFGSGVHDSLSDVMSGSDDQIAAYSDDSFTTETDNTFDGFPEDL